MDETNLVGQAPVEMPKSPRSSPNAVRSIDVLAFPAVQLLDVTGPLQVFASANDIVAEVGGSPPYALRVVAQGGQGVTASAGLALAAEPLPPADAAVDTLMVAGGQGVEAAAADVVLVDWVRERATRARRVASVCTGAFLLAASGVLDGRRVATHWSICAELARRFPAVHVEPDPIFVRDGPIWTSAGVTAGIDLALALVEEDLGLTAALAVARYLVVFLKRPGGQAQFSAALSLQAAEDKFGALHAWINAHLADDMSLPVLASQAGMSGRSFSRTMRTQPGRRRPAPSSGSGWKQRDDCCLSHACRSSASRSAAASAPRKPCAAASFACWTSPRKITALGSKGTIPFKVSTQ
jgi:transcriptional regulator GlxA family with amidase domain